MRVALGYTRGGTSAEQIVQRTLAWCGPSLPHASKASVPRWTAGPTWTPPGSILLVRHRSLDGSRRIVTNDRVPPPGYAIEFDLGLVHSFSQPGTMRLVARRDGFFCTRFEGQLDDGFQALGYVEQAPLPMLEGLELRRDPASGEPTLVAGPADPLYCASETLGLVGFIESFPINPRRPLDVRVERGLMTLVRLVDDIAWRHRYDVVERHAASNQVALGGVWSTSHHATASLWAHPDGTVDSELLTRTGASGRSAAASLRWVGAPLAWAGARPRGWALRASASRARRLVQDLPRVIRPVRGERRLIGYMRTEPAPDWSPLYAARHPVLGDQYLTRSELEARDMGYVVEGLLGYVADRCASRSVDALTAEIKWASRFGQRRRYVEGPAPA